VAGIAAGGVQDFQMSRDLRLLPVERVVDAATSAAQLQGDGAIDVRVAGDVIRFDRNPALAQIGPDQQRRRKGIGSREGDGLAFEVVQGLQR
jgi:hypothetical protein